jgi:septal ring factor EnvC (AmiA/AmiB activator)
MAQQNDLSLTPLIYPQWNFEGLQDPRALQEYQISWYTIQLENEVAEHNSTRAMLQRYIAQTLANERALCAEKDMNRNLNDVIKELKTQLGQARMELARAEKKERALCAENDTNRNLNDVIKDLRTQSRTDLVHLLLPDEKSDWNRSPVYEPILVRALQSERRA